MKTPISIIIPVHNEEKILQTNVVKIMDELKKKRLNYEIILGENGSTDNTLKVGKQLNKKYGNKVKIFHTYQKGVGAGIAIAIKNTKYKKIIELPIDLSCNLDFIDKASKLLETNDLVIGSKILGTQNRHWWISFLGAGYYNLANFLLDLNYTDYSVGAKAYSKDLVYPLLEKIDNGSFYMTQFTYAAQKNKLKIVEIPTTIVDKRESKFNFNKEIVYRTKNLVKLTVKHKLGK